MRPQQVLILACLLLGVASAQPSSATPPVLVQVDTLPAGSQITVFAPDLRTLLLLAVVDPDGVPLTGLLPQGRRVLIFIFIAQGSDADLVTLDTVTDSTGAVDLGQLLAAPGGGEVAVGQGPGGSGPPGQQGGGGQGGEQGQGPGGNGPPGQQGGGGQGVEQGQGPGGNGPPGQQGGGRP